MVLSKKQNAICSSKAIVNAIMSYSMTETIAKLWLRTVSANFPTAGKLGRLSEGFAESHTSDLDRWT